MSTQREGTAGYFTRVAGSAASGVNDTPSGNLNGSGAVYVFR